MELSETRRTVPALNCIARCHQPRAPPPCRPLPQAWSRGQNRAEAFATKGRVS
jgi:hypothetical protein